SDDQARSVYSLALATGDAWQVRVPELASFEHGASDDSSEDCDVQVRDVVPGGDSETLIEMTSDWYDGDSTGTNADLYVCGVPDGQTDLVCARVPTEQTMISDNDGNTTENRCSVRLLGEGRVRIRGRMDGSRVDEETTVAALWEREIAAHAPPTPAPVDAPAV